MNRRFRLTKRSDFQRVRRAGKSYAHPLVVVIKDANQLPISRFGFSVGKSIGGAVRRNRIKRQLRAVLSRMMDRVDPGWDVVLVARAPMADVGWETISRTISSMLRRAGILKN